MRIERRLVAAIAIALWGLLFTQAGAAEVTVQAEPDINQPYELFAPGDSVSMNVYAYMPDSNSKTGIGELYGALSSGFGGNLGNLTFTAAPGLMGTGFSNGTQQDLDGDGDLDVGSKGQSTAGWIHLTAGLGGYAPVAPGTNKVLLGTATFTLTNFMHTVMSPNIVWVYRQSTHANDVYEVDGMWRFVTGSSSALDSRSTPLGPLTYYPVTQIDKNGHGLDPSGGGLPYTIGQDPGPGGLGNALIYGNGPRGTVGDVRIFEPNSSHPSQIVRFNGNGTIVFYSEPDGPNLGLADTGLPAQFYANVFDFHEWSMGRGLWTGGTANGYTWTGYVPADPNQPGYDSPYPYYGMPPAFLFVTGVPEPLTGCILAVGLVAWVSRRRA